MNLIQFSELGQHEQSRMLMVKEHKKNRDALRTTHKIDLHLGLHDWIPILRQIC